MLFGNELEVRLGALQPALAGDAARADRNGRLDDVVPGAEWVLRRIEQGEDAAPLIVVQQAPQRRQAGERGGAQSGQNLPGQAGEENHVETRGRDKHGSAEVGLAGDQQHRHDEQHAGDEKLPRAQARFVAVEPPREHQRHRDLHHLGGLEARHADMQPAARTVDHVAEQRHCDQQQHAGDIGGHGETHQRLRRDLGDQPHQAERDQNVHRLARDARGQVVAGAVQRRQAKRDQRTRNRYQRAVDPG